MPSGCVVEMRLPHGGPAVSAEKRFRSRLVKRGLLFDVPAMLIVDAAVVAIGIDELERRQAISGMSAVEILANREPSSRNPAIDKADTSRHRLHSTDPGSIRYRYVSNVFAKMVDVPYQHKHRAAPKRSGPSSVL